MGSKIPHNIVFWFNCLKVHCLYNTRCGSLSWLQFCYGEVGSVSPLLEFRRAWDCISWRSTVEVTLRQFWNWSRSGPTVFTLVPQSSESFSGSVTALLRDHVERPHDSVEKERSSARICFQLSPSRCQAGGEVSGTLQINLVSS